MDDDGISQVAILIILLIMSAFFSACEAAFNDYSRIRMKNLACSNNKKAELVIRLDEKSDSLISTILIFNNTFNITAASLAVYIFSKNFESNGIAISTTLILLAILIFGELIPKGLAQFAPEKFAMFAAPIMSIFIFLCSPINTVIAALKKMFYKLFETEIQPSITEDELRTMIDEVENEGVINKNESDLIRSAIEFNETVVEDIYTPRIEIVGIEEDESLDEIKEKFLVSGYSRLPVFQGDMDNIVGVLHEKDFYQALSRKEKDIKKLVSKIIYITPNKKISELLKELQRSKAHMAAVIDEYGGTEGIVTMEDIIEELVGEIWDEHDEVIEWFKKIGDDKYLVSCNADVDDMFELFNIEPDEEVDVTTVNGWITMLFEEIPDVGGKMVYKNLHITITKAEAKRVLEIQVEKINEEENKTL
ncbi:HlyC/CorC family transporter [Sedimentibacter saalensis]|jgi:CBS domain containing-hemolysin-like protein|uniref:CBS domain containing-hemolysin-like protein n=2 Tax=root TaxID=1 RepID=A0A562J987_9FIRM|nr:hemolysin family protein [Sedimentibacter saalensis]MEA5096150.1 hemolysin family protein [Sedimentibacter saalensis]TWH79726.1 CBS domain containing-hemolysin-like protein [Sedimentibacter saalensis]